MAEPNYMAYAQYMGARNPLADGINQISGTLSDLQKQGMAREDQARRNSLADLQMRQGQMKMQSAQGELADQQAKRGAMQSLYGVNNPQDAYLAEMKQKQASADKQGDMNAIKEIFGLSSKIKEKGLQPQIVEPLIKGMAGTIKDEKLRGIYENIKINPDWSSETVVPLDGSEGMKHPITGKPLGAGVWKLKIAPDGKTPIGADYVKNIEVQQPKYIPEGAAVPDGKGGYTIPAPKRERPIVVNAGGGRGGGGGRSYGKAPSGYRYTEDGNLEAIPGGPAALKVDAVLQGKEKAKGAYDSSIAVVDKLLAHPGRKAGTGLSSKVDPRNYTPGTDAYDFQRELESFDSVLFLSNIEKMKGMGALSNAEGAKVSAAAGAIKPGMKDTTFVNNLRIIRAELGKAKQRIDSGNLIGAQGTQRPAGKTKDPLGIL